MRDLGARANLGLGYGTITHPGNHHENIPEVSINFIRPCGARVECTPAPPWPNRAQKLQPVSRLSLKYKYMYAFRPLP